MILSMRKWRKKKKESEFTVVKIGWFYFDIQHKENVTSLPIGPYSCLGFENSPVNSNRCK